MKKKVFIIILIMLIILNIIIFLYDLQIIKFILSIRNKFLDYLFLSVTFISNKTVIILFLTILFLWKKNKRRWVFPLWVGSFFTAFLSYLIKISVARLRPFQNGISVLQTAFQIIENNFDTWNFSFPSFQTALIFSTLPILNKEFRNFKYVWIGFAILVGFSRVYLGVHYLSDVLAGAIMGYLIGFAIVLTEEKKSYGEKILRRVNNYFIKYNKKTK